MKARLAGVFYLLTIVLGIVALAGGRLVVSGDAAATAANILQHQPSFWLGFAANLGGTACYVAVTALFFELFEPVNRSLSLLAAFFSLVGCAVGAVSCVFLLAAFAALGGAPWLHAFAPEQLQALALLSLKLSTQATGIGLVFFAVYCLLIGRLIFESDFLPRILGAGMLLAGAGWLTFLWPPLANRLMPWNFAPGILGESALTIWLLAKGVSARRRTSRSPPR